MVGFGPWEWLLVGLIALLLFGPGLFVRTAGSLGKGVSEFRRSVKDGDEVRQDHDPQDPGSPG